MKTFVIEVCRFYTLIIQQENDSDVIYCRVKVTGANAAIKDRVTFENNFDNHVKWAQSCINIHQRETMAFNAFNLN